VLLSGTAGDERRLQQLQRCRDRLIEEGIDLGAYTSAASAADLADLRAALGYGPWNLYGLSYGSRLALTVMRDHPDGLRSVVLDGAYPPNVNRYELVPGGFEAALAALVSACDADSSCARDYPDLADTIGEVLERGADDPLTVVADDPHDRSPVRVELTDRTIADGLFSALRDPESVRALPFVLDQLSQGNADAALPLVQRTLDLEGHDAEGLAQSVECAEEIPFNDDTRIADAMAAGAFARHLSVPALREECAIWGVPALSAAENAAVSSGVPTLIVTGGFDPATPAPWAQAAAAGLTAATSVVFPSSGHGAVSAVWASTCPSAVAAAFLRDPTAAPDAACAERMPPVDFVTTDDIDPTSAIYLLDRDLRQDRDPAQLAVAAVTVLLLAATVLYGIGYGLAWLVRRRGGAPEGAVLAASVAAGANLTFVGALSVLALTSEPLLLALGTPPAAWPLYLLPFVAIAATAVLVVLVVRAWIGGDGSTGDRMVLSLSALASIGFAIWLLSRGLLTL
ncbi:MAG: alpha/beta fold hydrolase, partial [Microbacterium sp.]